MLLRNTLIAVFFSFTVVLQGQTTWQHTYGGYGIDEGHGIRETQDHGFIIVGSTGSFGNGSSDLYVLKVDSAGTRQWSEAFGGPSVDQGWSVRQLSDGGYIVVGFTHMDDSTGYDGLLIRLNNVGGLVWQRVIGSIEWDFLYDVEVLSDGFVLVGSTYINGVSDKQGWLVRTDLSGNVLWERDFGGVGENEARCVRIAVDGGIVVAGTEGLPDGTCDAIILKYDSSGEEEWSTMLGDDSLDMGHSLVQTMDGGFVVGGTSIGPGSESAMMMAKVNSDGAFQWINHVSGGQGDWDGRSIRENYDGGLVLSGTTTVYGAGGEDYYMAQTDAQGNWVSGPNFGSNGNEECWDMDLVSDGGYVLVGTTDGIGPGASAVYVVKNAGDVITDPFVTDFDPLDIKEEIVSANHLVLAPNPLKAGAIATLSPASLLTKGWIVELYNIQGNCVYEFKGLNNQMEIPISLNLSTGVYIMHLLTSSGMSFSSPIIIETE